MLLQGSKHEGIGKMFDIEALTENHENQKS